jgi:hypothetical protein
VTGGTALGDAGSDEQARLKPLNSATAELSQGRFIDSLASLTDDPSSA